MARFIRNEDGTVTDTKTNLVYIAKTLAEDVDHEGAEKIAASTGDGFRLPTVDELFSLVDHSKHSPAIDTEFFPDVKNDWYWTSTPCAWNPESAVWVVNFHLGDVYDFHRLSGACVVAVRSSQ